MREGKFSRLPFMFCVLIIIGSLAAPSMAQLEQIRLNAYLIDTINNTGEHSHMPPHILVPDYHIIEATELYGLGGTNTSYYLPGNHLTELGNINILISMQTLVLTNEHVRDISPINGMAQLQFLNMQDGFVTELGDLSDCVNLEEIYLDNNYVTDFSGFTAPATLWRLFLSDNNIRDISALPAAIAETTELAVLDLRGNPLNAEAINVYIPQLETQFPSLEILYDEVVTDGDINSDGCVDIYDFLILKGSYGAEYGDITGELYDTPPFAKWSDGDLDSDGDVDIFDFLTLKANYGATN